jgi:hypothetical protein
VVSLAWVLAALAVAAAALIVVKTASPAVRAAG